MAARATRLDQFTTQSTFEVASGQTVTKGRAVLLASADDKIQHASTDSDLAIGIAMETKTTGLMCDVYLFGPVVPVVVGTGGATRGTKAVLVSDGFTDAPAHDSDGTGNEAVYGIFMQSGVAADTVGLMLSGAGNRGAAS